MDSGEKRDWKWLPAQMPRLAKLLADKRKEVGPEWVNECWKRGVLQRQPGWFFGADGALAVGVPWEGAPGMQLWMAVRDMPPFDPVLLILRDKGAADGS